MEYTIIHQGKVTAVDGTTVSVAVSDSSGCQGCALTASCGVRSAPSSGSMLVEARDGRSHAVGAEVRVGLPSGVTHRAVFRLLCVPLLLMLACAALVALAGAGEGTVALAGLASVAAWYAGLFVWSRFRPSPPLWRVID